ncbi:hypothetical protein Hanom_Chr04g00302561 [Helianthus anomalus]
MCNGDYIKMAMIKSYGRNHVESLWQMFAGFSKDLPLISVRIIFWCLIKSLSLIVLVYFFVSYMKQRPLTILFSSYSLL